MMAVVRFPSCLERGRLPPIDIAVYIRPSFLGIMEPLHWVSYAIDFRQMTEMDRF